jgi:predicted Zn-dependent peptidase
MEESRVMKLVLALVLLLSSLFGGDPYKDLDYYVLDNGMKIYLLSDEKAKNVSIEMEVNVGMKAEDKDSAGISHLVEHIVFRDQRVEGRDYYNIIKDKGATYVNGYTSYYKTQYVTTINPENAYWIADTFYKMLFDKNVTDEDLRIEKGALQLEIGEPTWLDRLLPDASKMFERLSFLKKIFPPSDDVFEKDFGIDLEKEKRTYQAGLDYKLNNKKFTLKEVLDHYHDYYYPSNMSLKIVGKFDKDKMKKLIDETFAKVKKGNGKSVKEPLFKDAKLDDKPYELYFGGINDTSTITLGAKLLQDDPKKIVVLKAYMESLADRLLKKFRNKQGEAYGVSGYVQTFRNAAIAQVSFSSPHNAFDKNVKTAKEWIKKESNGDINDTVIAEAIKQKRNKYDAVEHDVNSLMDSVKSYIYYHRFFKDAKNPYELLDDITPDYFRSVLKDTFVPEHSYMVMGRDYVLFPYEGGVLILFSAILFGFYFSRFIGTKVEKRKVRLKRSLVTWFTSLFIMALIFFLMILVESWIVYLISKIVPISENMYDIPLSYLLTVVILALDIIILYAIVKIFFGWYYRKLFVTDSELILVGVYSKHIKLDQIDKLEVIPYFPRKWGKIYGNSILFWKKLLKVKLKTGEELYLRSTNAKHLKEDIESLLRAS